MCMEALQSAGLPQHSPPTLLTLQDSFLKAAFSGNLTSGLTYRQTGTGSNHAQRHIPVMNPEDIEE